MRIFNKLFLSLLLVLSFSSFIQADPIRLVSGSVVAVSGNPTTSPSSIFFSGDGLNGRGDNIYSSFLTPLCRNRCDVVGSSFNLTAQFFTGDLSNSPLNNLGRVEYLGNQFAVTSSYFSFTTNQTGILPPITSFPNGDYATAFANHTMTATLNLRSLSSTIPNAVLNLTGGGIASIDYVFNPNRSGLDIGFIRYNYTNAEANFIFDKTVEPTPEPTPEPATILLLGTGLIGILGYARKRKKTST